MEYLSPAVSDHNCDVIDLAGRKYSIRDKLFYENIPANGHLAEVQKELNGIFIDIDNKTNTDISSSTVYNIITTYCETLIKEYYIESSNYTFKAYDLRKKNSKSVHILIPELFVSKHIRADMVTQLKDVYEYIDSSSYASANIFKGHTKIDCLFSYDIIKGVYDITIDKDYNTTISVLNNVHDISAEVLSITNPDNNVLTVTQALTDIPSHLEKYKLEPLTYSRREFKTLLSLLPDKYAEDYELWRNIMFIAKWIDANPLIRCNIDKFDNPIDSNNEVSVLDDFIEFSERCPEKCDHNKIRRDYSRVKPVGLTIRTLHYYASIENRDYERLRQQFIDRTCYQLSSMESITHYYIAQYLYECFINEYKCINGKTWYIMKAGKWVETNTNQLSMHLSTTIKDRIVTCIKKIIKATTDKIVIKECKKRITKVTNSLESNTFKLAVLKEAAIFYDRQNEQFDAHEHTIGVDNGVLTVNNKAFINTYNDYNIKKSMASRYLNPIAENVNYVKDVIASIIPEDDAREFILCYFASCLVNTTREPLILLLTGCGCNGKSTLLELMSTAMGDYASKFHLSLLLDKRESSSAANSSMMAFKHTRFVYSSETNPTDEINTSRLKELTSNEKVVARDLYKSQETFSPNAAICLASNHDIIINSYDHGTWRRIKYYSCKTKFVDTLTGNAHEKIKDPAVIQIINDQLMLDAFLCILLEYYDILQKKYGGTLMKIKSDTIEKETYEYRNRFDPLNEFITNYCVKSKTAIQPINDFITAFLSWCHTYKDNYKSFNRSSIMSIIQNSSIVNFLHNDMLVGFKTIYNTTDVLPLTDTTNICADIIILPDSKYYTMKEDEKLFK